MNKLVLIDGNSLLNRAYYAMAVFSTKDGLPTNGIFGFVKLILKIVEEEKPQYMAVAFDVHAPTFRHKMFKEYKGTRKPMPEDLVKQVPVLKELLSAMKICTVEKAGYEADDLIGTLSRKFDGVHTLIYTGDRDAYQLVNDRVSVYFTRRGVSDIDRMTAENFVAKESIRPDQIIEQKALMGDSSDNIPGVRGIGPKSALELLKQYDTLDGIYEHIAELKDAYRLKLTENKEIAYLSRTLATIDTQVPLETTLDECILNIPFSEEARAMFAKLEFRSLVDSKYFPEARKVRIETVYCNRFEEFFEYFRLQEEFAFALEKDCHVYCGRKEFIFTVREDILQQGFYYHQFAPLFKELFTGTKRAIVADLKALGHKLDEFGIEITCPVEDVSLLRYLGDSNLRPAAASELAKDYVLPVENCAFALKTAFDEAIKKTEGTEEESLYRDLELPLARILLDMERIGVRVDIGKFPEFAENFNGELEKLSEQIFRLAGGESFNLNSPFQLSRILFEKLGYSSRGAKKNIRGGYSTNAEVLERLAEDYEIAQLILQYREIQKLQSTYIDGIKPLIVNEVVHTTYNQTVTTTGRLSSANPNLQNIPVRKERGRELRKLFIAREGNILLDADYSQIELRLLAHFSGCKPLQQAYNEGKDIHAITAAQVFGVPLSEVTPLMRRRAKAVNFGIIYGISPFGLAKDIGCSTTEAAEYIDRYFKTYSDVKEYMDENVRRAKADGYVTTILGRRRYIPELKSSNFNLRSFGERAAMNMPLQGSSADIIKIAMVNVCNRLKKENLRARMIVQVHDELILDTPLEEKERAAVLLREEMERAVQLRVPLIAEVSEGASWYDAK